MNTYKIMRFLYVVEPTSVINIFRKFNRYILHYYVQYKYSQEPRPPD